MTQFSNNHPLCIADRLDIAVTFGIENARKEALEETIKQAIYYLRKYGELELAGENE
jgi:hypothetical protein